MLSFLISRKGIKQTAIFVPQSCGITVVHRHMQALFKARFEQALDSQKLNIKKTEQELRRKGINPEDPVAMASIQRVASTFFNAIDKKEGTPYVFYGDKQTGTGSKINMAEAESNSDSDQEELDRFIAEIEDAADRDWVAEEAAEKEELSQIRYRNREEHGGRFRRSDMRTNDSSENEMEKPRVWRQRDSKQRLHDSEEEDDHDHENEEEWDSDDGRNANNIESGTDDSDGAHGIVKATRGARGRHDLAKNKSFKRDVQQPFVRKRMDTEASEPENMLSDLESAMWESDEEEEDDMKVSRYVDQDYKSKEDDLHHNKEHENNRLNDYDSNVDESDEAYDRFEHRDTKQKQARMKNSYNYVSKDVNSGNAMWDSDDEEESGASRTQRYDYWSGSDEDDK